MVLLVLRLYKLYVYHPTMNVTFLTYPAQLRSTSVPSTVDHNSEEAFISTTNRLQNLFWFKLLCTYISRCSINLYTDCSIFRLVYKYIKSDSVETSKWKYMFAYLSKRQVETVSLWFIIKHKIYFSYAIKWQCNTDITKRA